MRLLPILLLAWAGAFCQDVRPQAGGPVPVDNGITPPKIAHTVSAAITDEAGTARLHGNVVLAVVVGANGFAEDVRILRSMGMGLDERAMEAVKSKRWWFTPGMKNGVPVPATATVEVNVGLSDVGWSLTRAEFDTPAGADRPVVQYAPYPSLSRLDEKHGTVTVSLDITREGLPENLRSETSSNPALENEAISIAQGWKFRPAKQDGNPIPVHCTLNFVVSNP
ncbi:MAG: energy transducer TonB [Acidobacteriia bacterium]|nr:energy transducer TonB [Terriglobia bacterium]